MPVKTVEINLFENVSEETLEVLDMVTFEDLNTDMQMLAERYGMDFVRDMMANFGGYAYHVLVPASCRRAVEELTKQKIREKMDVKRLAVKYKLNEDWVYKIRRAAWEPEQYELFGPQE